jgi:hypothetical protein
MAADTDLYHATIRVLDDDAGTTDRWLVTWHKNGARLTAGVTAATIAVIKAADGTNLFTAATLTQVTGTATWQVGKTTTERLVDGAAYVAVASATIDGSTRTVERSVGLDSSA